MWQNETNTLYNSASRFKGNTISSQAVKSTKGYTTPSKQRVEHAEANSRYISCIIQLKDHISYIDIFLTNVSAKINLFKNSLSDGLFSYERLLNAKLEFDTLTAELIKELKKALYKNNDTIEKFSHIIRDISNTSGKSKDYKEKLRETSIVKEDEVLREGKRIMKLTKENTELKSGINELKQLIEKESKSHDDICKAYEDRIKQLKVDKELLMSKLGTNNEQKCDLKNKEVAVK